MNKKIIIIFIISLLTVTFGFTPIVQAGNDDASNEGEYYFAYGDSITAGKEINACDSGHQLKEVYVSQMRRLYDYSSSSDHVSSWGDGKESDNGVNNFNTWYHSGNDYFVFMFGNNDMSQYFNFGGTQYTPTYYANNMMQMYNWTLENGSIPMLCCSCAYQYIDGDGYTHDTPSNYMPYLNESMEIWKNNSIRFVPMWDALDNDPMNGIMEMNDYANYNCSDSRSHCGYAGHNAMADMLWYFIQGWDYNTTYHSGNNTMFVDADYNETIFINNSYWDNSTVTVEDMGTRSPITFSFQTDFYGYEVIRFDITKGSQYKISENTVFLDICGEQNNSDLEPYGGTRWGNITIPTAEFIPSISEDSQILSVEYYMVRVSNSTNFDASFLNETGLNRWFNLTDPITYYGVHYYNAGFRVKVVSN